ncbi:hypothetical protein Tco_1442602, partial [Tanacetum coccineum]
IRFLSERVGAWVDDGDDGCMVGVLGDKEEGVRMEADMFFWLPVADLQSAIHRVLRGAIGREIT